MEKNEIVGYEPLVNDLKQLIQKKQYHVLKMINSETINLYWEIGEEIYRQQQVKLPDENPSIGIIICKSKDKTYVEYALKQTNAPIGVATYQLRNTLPEDMKAMLLEPEEIVKRLRIFEK